MNQIVYVASPESQQIYVWKLNQCGSLALLQILDTSLDIHTMTIHPNKKYLYAGARPKYNLISYKIQKNGTIQKIDNIKLNDSSTYLTIDYSGTYLYSASYHENTITVISLKKNGRFGSIVQIIQNVDKCHSVNINIIKNELWVPCLGKDYIKIFYINNTGILNIKSILEFNSPIRLGPRHMVFNYIQNCVYIINEYTGNISVINIKGIHKNNKLRTIQILNILPTQNNNKYWSADIHITPDAHWLYCTDRANNIISCFKVNDNTGKLKFSYCQLTEIQPREFNIDSTGHFLIVAGQKSHSISIYIINKLNGQLTFLNSKYTGQGPTWISIL